MKLQTYDIDDNEVANLRLLMNEIFGKDNFIGQLVWRKRTGSNDALANLSIDHEYILAYGKYSFQNFRGIEKGFENYKNPDNDPRGEWTTGDLTCNKTAKERPNLNYPITDPKTGKTYQANQNRVWAYSKERMERYISEEKILFPKKANGTPMYKRHKSEVRSQFKPISSLLGDFLNTEATKNLKEIFGKQVFDYSKDFNLIKFLVSQSTSENDIILDSFAGSGTTAQAVLEQNREDGGNRKFILVEMEKHIAKPITAERVKRVVNGYSFKGKQKTELFTKKLTSSQILNSKTMSKIADEVAEIEKNQKDNFTKIEKKFDDKTISVNGILEIDEFKNGLGSGFKFCQLGENLLNEFDELNLNLPFSTIAKHLYFLEFKQPLKNPPKRGNFIGEFRGNFLYFFGNQKFTFSDLSSILLTLNDYEKIIVYSNLDSISKDFEREYNLVFRKI
jgi:adenine-specific DNA-methyltransferase